MDDLKNLSVLVRHRNEIDVEISKLIHRPALIGHIGEFIASRVFGIALMKAANHKGIDGHFVDGNLAERSVNIKFYSSQQGILDVPTEQLPDFFLVITGPKSIAMSSRGKVSPLLIEAVFLIDTKALTTELKKTGVKIGIATSVRKHVWNEAEIYPAQRSKLILLSQEQRNLLELFGSGKSQNL